jgi:hypothetical protein
MRSATCSGGSVADVCSPRVQPGPRGLNVPPVGGHAAGVEHADPDPVRMSLRGQRQGQPRELAGARARALEPKLRAVVVPAGVRGAALAARGDAGRSIPRAKERAGRGGLSAGRRFGGITERLVDEHLLEPGAVSLSAPVSVSSE